ncbi:HpcH/HpaI aldolase/citrate lyase family protein [Pseudomonas sp. BGr12]|uniref:HpcH/HpaI aldolase/citrate lyase family protein n=1 Tax=Pseudomonas sp. BGr12 TaxID=2936269 RepID=UPI002559BB64|nr:CoA ester lyase [Pseudomonas sp. BJa5]MDL2428395.1 CoA ester lyase [Pseudomonas sp. BJa5]
MTAHAKLPIRSALFVPGNRPERFLKALNSAADAVIIDLEDAVDEEQKAEARNNIQGFLESNPDASVVVRINSVNHAEHGADVEFCAASSQIKAVILPKAESRSHVERVGGMGKAIWPLIETAEGIAQIDQIAQSANAERLTYGALDMAVDLGLKAGTQAAERMFDHVRFAIVQASARYKLSAPLETVYADISDSDGLKDFAENALYMGMGGMLCIHPAQAEVVNLAFSPSQQEIAWAQAVVEAAKGAPAAFRLNGKMIDAPVIAHAIRICRNAGKII